MGWIHLQFLQSATLIQLSLLLQNLVHVLCELGVETLGDLAWFANCYFMVSLTVRLCPVTTSVNTSKAFDSLPLLSMIT